MTDREKPKCPYCGKEMKASILEMNGFYYGEYRCRACNAFAPNIDKAKTFNEAKKAAFEAAMKRPLQKPIAETDLGKYLDTPVWFEEFGRDVEDLPLLLDGIGIYYAEFKEFGKSEWLDRRIDDYNYQWRCWAEKPTEEERKAAEWES